MQWKNKRVMVYGGARSGIAAVTLLQKLGAEVVLFDGNTKLTKDSLKDKLDTEHQFRLYTGTIPETLLKEIELLVISPGVPTDHPDILQIKQDNIPVWGEVELAFHVTKGRIIGITGTNGKTTTTTLVGEIMKAWYEEVFVVGNIGRSYSERALDTTQESVSVIELSSFQLETIREFKPDISMILNITPDHLDRHYTMDHYIAMKERIALNQTERDLCILNYEDEALRDMAHRLKAKVLYFSSLRKLEDGLYLDQDDIIYQHNNRREIVCNTKELKLLGTHNYENVMAAVAASVAMGIPMEIIHLALVEFPGVEHRIEYVETIHGITYYNDSKGTNPDASIRAIMAMRAPTILIAGGYDKKVVFHDLIKALPGKVKYLVLLGQTREQLAATARQYGFTNVVMTDDLREAVRVSTELATPGDAVLLSPACASWGMFRDFEQRGTMFKEYVREML